MSCSVESEFENLRNFLQSLKDSGRITNYMIDEDSSDGVNVDVFITPIRPIEFINVEIKICN